MNQSANVYNATPTQAGRGIFIKAGESENNNNKTCFMKLARNL